MEELKRVIAYVVKKKGDKELNQKDFVNILSHDMRWVEPKTAKKLFQVCIDAGLLEEKEGSFYPTFKISGIILPLDFSVGEDMVEKYAAKQDIFSKIIDHICASTDMDRGDVIMKVNAIKNELNFITIEVATLVLCKEIGVDCSKFYPEVERKIKSS